MSTININNNIIYGIDIGGTKIEIARFSSNLILLDSWRVPTPTNDYDEFLTAINNLVIEADSRSSQACPIGVGMPGVINQQGLVISANIACATGQNLQQDLTRVLQREVAIANDCRLFALSECYGGAGNEKRRVYGAILGTGAAGGFCINGELYHGRNSYAGEYGHLPASGYLLQHYDLPIRDCGCGLKGCFEPYIAGPGLGWLYQYFGSGSTDTKKFVEQLRLGNNIAAKTFHCYMDFLGAAFATLVLSYDPDIIVVGGGLSKIDEVLDALPDAINKHLFDGVESPHIARAIFGDSSGVRGAAILRNSQIEN